MGRCLSRHFTISNKIVTDQVIWMLSESRIWLCISQNSKSNQKVIDFTDARTGEIGRMAPHGLQTSLSAPGDDFLTHRRQCRWRFRAHDARHQSRSRQCGVHPHRLPLTSTERGIMAARRRGPSGRFEGIAAVPTDAVGSGDRQDVMSSG